MRFKLDSASTMFVLGRNKNRNYLIRLSVTLRDCVKEKILQTALERTTQKYPYFFVRFVNNKNRLLAESTTYILAVKEQNDVSGLELWEDHEKCEARVTYSRKTISLEFSHAVSDGKGGIEFLKHLVAEYLSILYDDEKFLSSVPIVSRDRQFEDGYRKYAKGFRMKKSHGTAFQIKGTPASTEISNYCFSACEVKQAAQKYDVSVTEFMAALLCLAVAGIQNEICPKSKQKWIRLLIPVNLRTRFPCDTMRNFTLNVSLEATPEEAADLSRMCMKFHRTMQTATKPEQLAGQCASAAKACDSGIIKNLPVSVKKWLVRTGLSLPLSGNSMTFSNMGVALWPEELKSHVEELDMVFSAKPEAPYSCSAISINDKMRFTLLRTIKEPVLERQLEKILSAQNINFKKL